MIWLALIAFFLLLSSWITKKLHHTFGVLTLICFLFGICLGYFHQIPPLKGIRGVSELTLIFLLFIDGVRLHFPKILHYHKEAFRQMTIGFLIQVILGMLLAHHFLFFSWISSFMLSLALSSIDLRVSPILLAKEKIPARISQIFNLESSATLLFSVFLFMVFKEQAFLPIVLPIAFGLIFGFFVIYFMRQALRRGFADRPFLISSLLVASLALFYFCKSFHLNGFIGVIVLALTLGHRGRSFCDGLFDFGRRQGTFLFFLFIILFGCQILDSLAYSLNFKMTLYVFLSLFVIRLIAVFVSFFNSQFQWKTLFFCAFFGPRALVPITLALLIVPYNLPLYTTLYEAALMSLFLHTLPAFFLTCWYCDRIEDLNERETLPTVSLPRG